MALIDDLREHRRLARMRLGQDAPDLIALKSAPEIRVALVPLTEAEYELGLHAAAGLDVQDNAYGVEARDRLLQVNNLFHAVRDPNDTGKKLFESPEQLATELENVDINHLTEMYGRLVDDSSPALEGLSDEDLDDLKKALETIDWNALSGKPWFHLKSFFLTLTPEQLRVSSFGFSSIKKLIGTSEEQESIPGV